MNYGELIYQNDQSRIITRKETFDNQDFIKVTHDILALTHENDLIIVIDDKSVSTALGLIGCICSERDILIIEIKQLKKSINKIINDLRPEAILGSKEAIEGLSSTAKQLNNNLYIWKIKNEKNNIKLKTNSPILLISTSGTSGNFKFVALTHKSLYDNCRSINSYLCSTNLSRTINNLPLSYSYGLSILNTTLIAGGAYICGDKSTYVRQEFWDDCKFFEITDFSGVPSTYINIVDTELINKLPLSIKTITQAGGRLEIQYQQKLLAYCLKKNINLYIMYGQTEATARLTAFNLKEYPNKIGSVGVPIQDVTLILASEKKSTYENIELKFLSTGTFLDYIVTRDDLINLSDKNNGEISTGDLANIDEDGFIYIIGRRSRICKINGKRISLDLLEKELEKISNNIICVSNDQKLYIITSYQYSIILEKNILDAIKKETGLAKIIVEVLWFKEIIFTNNGKISYQEMEEIYL